MPDYGARVADRTISAVDRSLRATYKIAQRELREKLRDFNRRFAEKDKQKKQEVRSGKISKQDYQDWLAGQVFIRGQWQSKLKDVEQVMLNHNREAMRIINESKLNVFAENYNYQAFLAEKQMLGVSFNIYNTQAVARLILDDPQILPEWKIDEEKDYEWNYKKVNNIVKQGIIQGEGVLEITRRLCTDLATMNENKMRMFARTAITGAQNAGRQQQMNDAAEMGIDVHKQWLATMDSRTRDLHRERDGEEVPYNEDFSGGLEYPGDPSGDPADVYNCRCTMVTIYPKYEDRSKRNWREDVEIDGKSYEEWKYEKYHAPDKLLSKEYNEYVDAGIKISKASQTMIDEAFEKCYTLFKPLRESIKSIMFTRVPGGASSSPDGTVVKLDKKTFSTVKSAKKRLKKLIASGHTQNTTDPRFMIAHEVGHCAETYIARQKAGLGFGIIRGFQEMILNQTEQEMGTQYYLHMGFGDELDYFQIRDIISREIGTRALDSTSELFAHSFANVLFGTNPSSHARKLVDYVLSLADER